MAYRYPYFRLLFFILLAHLLIIFKLFNLTSLVLVQHYRLIEIELSSLCAGYIAFVDGLLNIMYTYYDGHSFFHAFFINSNWLLKQSPCVYRSLLCLFTCSGSGFLFLFISKVMDYLVFSYSPEFSNAVFWSSITILSFMHYYNCLVICRTFVPRL